MRKQKIATTSGSVSNGNQSRSSLLKLQHLQNIAGWASGDAAVLPSISVCRRFVACREAVGAPLNDSLFTCERCETILYPGDNCTVRIEKNKAWKCCKRKGSKVHTRNKVVYMCHFCSHRTMKRGTLNGHMNRICPPKDESNPQAKVRIIKPEESADTETCANDGSNTHKTFENLVTEPCSGDAADVAVDVAIVDTPAPVSVQVEVSKSLLDAKKRKRNKPGSKIYPSETDTTGDVNASKKRKKKTWTSLKDMVKSSGTRKPSSMNLPNITIPFFLQTM